MQNYIFKDLCGGIVCTYMCKCSQSPEEAVIVPGAGVTGGCKPPDMGARNQTLTLCNSSKHF